MSCQGPVWGSYKTPVSPASCQHWNLLNVQRIIRFLGIRYPISERILYPKVAMKWKLSLVALILVLRCTLASAAGEICPAAIQGCFCRLQSFRQVLFVCEDLGQREDVPPFLETSLFLESVTIRPQTSIRRIQDDAFAGLRTKRLFLEDLDIQELSPRAFATLGPDLQELYLNRNRLTSVPKTSLADLGALRYLGLDGNLITRIDRDTFNGLPDLLLLYLAHNDIESIDPQAFHGLSSLSRLYLSNNRIQQLHETTFHAQSDLLDLELGGNELTVLEAELLSPLRVLERLDVSENALQDLSQGLFLLNAELVYLGLAHNNLEWFPSGMFASGCKLRHLDLSHNDLVNIEAESLLNLDELETLRLSHNRLVQFDWSLIERLPNLISLDMHNNEVAELSPISREGNLGDIILSNNSLSSIPDGLFSRMPYLTSIDLSYNEINEFAADAFAGSSYLTNLKLSHNNISRLPDGLFDEAVYLETLDLDYNSIDDLSAIPIRRLTYLTLLDISHNHIAHIPEFVFRNNGELTTLYLAHNRLQQLQFEQFNGLLELEYLYLDHNLLSDSLPGDLFQRISGLKTLDLSWNGLRSILRYSFYQLGDLEILNLCNNQVDYVASRALYYTKSLRYLYLCHNHLSTVPTRDIADINLVTLDVSYNDIPRLLLPGFRGLSLQELHVQGNPFRCDDCGLNWMTRYRAIQNKGMVMCDLTDPQPRYLICELEGHCQVAVPAELQPVCVPPTTSTTTAREETEHTGRSTMGSFSGISVSSEGSSPNIFSSLSVPTEVGTSTGYSSAIRSVSSPDLTTSYMMGNVSTSMLQTSPSSNYSAVLSRYSTTPNASDYPSTPTDGQLPSFETGTSVYAVRQTSDPTRISSPHPFGTSDTSATHVATREDTAPTSVEHSSAHETSPVTGISTKIRTGVFSSIDTTIMPTVVKPTSSVSKLLTTVGADISSQRQDTTLPTITEKINASLGSVPVSQTLDTTRAVSMFTHPLTETTPASQSPLTVLQTDVTGISVPASQPSLTVGTASQTAVHTEESSSLLAAVTTQGVQETSDRSSQIVLSEGISTSRPATTIIHSERRTRLQSAATTYIGTPPFSSSGMITSETEIPSRSTTRVVPTSITDKIGITTMMLKETSLPTQGIRVSESAAPVSTTGVSIATFSDTTPSSTEVTYSRLLSTMAGTQVLSTRSASETMSAESFSQTSVPLLTRRSSDIATSSGETDSTSEVPSSSSYEAKAQTKVTEPASSAVPVLSTAESKAPPSPTTHIPPDYSVKQSSISASTLVRKASEEPTAATTGTGDTSSSIPGTSSTPRVTTLSAYQSSEDVYVSETKVTHLTGDSISTSSAILSTAAGATPQDTSMPYLVATTGVTVRQSAPMLSITTETGMLSSDSTTKLFSQLDSHGTSASTADVTQASEVVSSVMTTPSVTSPATTTERPPNICPSLLAECYCIELGSRFSMGCRNLGTRIQLPEFRHSSRVFSTFEINSGSRISTIQDDAFRGLRILSLSLKHSGIERVDPHAFRGLQDRLRSLVLDDNAIKIIPTLALANFKTLDYVSVIENQIQEIGIGTFSGLVALTYINLSRNRLVAIDAYSFFGLTNLRRLFLSYNRLSYLNQELFRDLVNLSYLKLDNNRICELERGLFDNLYKLQVLDLSHNCIVEVTPDTFSSMPFLVSFFFSHNNLTVLPNVFSNHSRLEHADFSYNVLERVTSDVFRGVENLNSLRFCHNRISYIDWNVLSQLPGLRKIDISWNRLTNLSSISCDDPLPLTSLDLSGNNISHVPSGLLNRMTSLVSLDMSNNQVASLEVGCMGKNVNLQELQLAQNTLSDISLEPLKGLENLRYLNLSHNGIRKVETLGMGSLPKLQRLDLSHNSIQEIPEAKYVFFDNRNITHLDLSYNLLYKIDYRIFHGLDRVESLLLHHNQLYGALQHDLFRKLRRLQTLDLSHNYIRTLLRYTFYGLGHLKHLNLSHNELQYIARRCFSNAEFLEEIRLDHNQMSSLNRSSFQWLPYMRFVDLSSNRLTTVSWAFIETLRRADEIYIGDNPYSCDDCRMVWLQNTSSVLDYDSLRCHSTVASESNGLVMCYIKTHCLASLTEPQASRCSVTDKNINFQFTVTDNTTSSLSSGGLEPTTTGHINLYTVLRGAIHGDPSTATSDTVVTSTTARIKTRQNKEAS